MRPQRAYGITGTQQLSSRSQKKEGSEQAHHVRTYHLLNSLVKRTTHQISDGEAQ